MAGSQVSSLTAAWANRSWFARHAVQSHTSPLQTVAPRMGTSLCHLKLCPRHLCVIGGCVITLISVNYGPSDQTVRSTAGSMPLSSEVIYFLHFSYSGGRGVLMKEGITRVGGCENGGTVKHTLASWRLIRSYLAWRLSVGYCLWSVQDLSREF